MVFGPSELLHLDVEARLALDCIDDVTEAFAVRGSITVLVAAHEYSNACHLLCLVLGHLDHGLDGGTQPAFLEPPTEGGHTVVAPSGHIVDFQ